MSASAPPIPLIDPAPRSVAWVLAGRSRLEQPEPILRSIARGRHPVSLCLSGTRETMGASVRKLEPIQLKPWTLPVIVLALAVPIVAAFTLAGPAAGLAVGALAAAVIIVVAARAGFDEPIEVASSPGGRYMLLVVAISS